MEELIVLGTGNAMVTRCYNTCFALRQGDDYILVDAGGGNGILSQLQQADIPYPCIRHMIVTHAHCDHLLGVIWIIRKMGDTILSGKYDGDFSIWCHESIVHAISLMSEITLQKKHTELLGSRIRLNPITDGFTTQLLGQKFIFFDIHSSKLLQYGFTVQSGNSKLTCLGDEPYNPLCQPYVAGSHWLLCEAFCLYAQRDLFKPYEKHHSTVKDAAILAQELQIPNLVLWHTEDQNYAQRKELYTAEGKEFYNGNLYVPYDLETIALKGVPNGSV